MDWKISTNPTTPNGVELLNTVSAVAEPRVWLVSEVEPKPVERKIQDNFGNDPGRGRTFNLKILYFPIFEIPLFEICILKPRS